MFDIDQVICYFAREHQPTPKKLSSDKKTSKKHSDFPTFTLSEFGLDSFNFPQIHNEEQFPKLIGVNTPINEEI
jgi:hypothetical protein